jgi:TolB-like protein
MAASADDHRAGQGFSLNRAQGTRMKRLASALLIRLTCLVALAPAGPASAASSEARPKLAVLDFQANGASTSLASAAGGVVANEIDRLGVFKVISADSLRAIIAVERQRQILGCTETTCLSEIGGALGVDYLVSGRVSAIGQGAGARFSVDLTLSNVKRVSREASAIESAPAPRKKKRPNRSTRRVREVRPERAWGFLGA